MIAKLFENSIPSYLRGALRFNSNGEDGHGALSNPRGSSASDADDGCSYSVVRKSQCFLDNSSDGRPVMKCEKTEQRLKHCFGRPAEVVESKTECTEEDAKSNFPIWDNGISDQAPSFRSEHSPFELRPSFPFPSMEGTPADLESVFKVAEDFFNEAFNQFRMHRFNADEEMLSPRNTPFESRRSEIPGPLNAGDKQYNKPRKVPDYSDLFKGFEEV